MISFVKNVPTEQPTAEAWRHLRFFLHAPKTTARIRQVHGIPENKQVRNIEKQAEQIGHSIRQAERYFTASSQVGLATRPVLLYYGAVSLSQAVILLRGNGELSLDFRRKERRHNHHGLDLNAGAAEGALRSSDAESFLSKIACSVHLKADVPWGHFPLFYASLVPVCCTIHAQLFMPGKQSWLEADRPQVSVDPLPIDVLSKQALNVWSLLKGLPDVYFSLLDLSVSPDLCPGKIVRTVRCFQAPRPLNTVNDPAPPTLDAWNRVAFEDRFFINRISSDHKSHLKEFYKAENPSIAVMDEFGTSLHLALNVEGPDEQTVWQSLGYYPDVIEDVTGKKFYIVRPGEYCPEPAALLAILFCLSMLCRYYPDVWMGNIERNVELRELANSFLDVAYRKFPNLILDQMTDTKHNFTAT